MGVWGIEGGFCGSCHSLTHSLANSIAYQSENEGEGKGKGLRQTCRRKKRG